MTLKRLFTPAMVLLLWVISQIACKKEETILPPPPQGSTLSLNSFTEAQTCSTCHPQYYEEWKGSMHRYAANDPIWRLANNGLQSSTSGRLQSWCFQCHAPIGFLTKNAPPTFQFGELPGLVSEGVNCDFCHVMRAPFATTDQHIQYAVDVGGTKYGTLSNPAAATHGNGYDAAYDRSEMCRPCHDLIINGVPTEMTFTEWQRSSWGAMSFECQKCHMLTYTGRAAVGAPIREGLHRHDFPAVDIAMTDFPNKSQQRVAIDSLLKNSATMSVDAPSSATVADSVRVGVRVYNDKTGHNLPTSVFFFRQMWIEVTVWNGIDTVYRSGHRDANGDLMDSTSALNPNADSNLTIFSGVLYKNHAETNVFELDSLANNSIPPFGSREAIYRFIVPRTGMWNVTVRLLFRPFGPYLFRAVGGDQYIPQIPTFEMAREERQIDFH